VLCAGLAVACGGNARDAETDEQANVRQRRRHEQHEPYDLLVVVPSCPSWF
jgi:hypothetical protein